MEPKPPSQTPSFHLFTYGTLRPPEGAGDAPGLLGGCERVGTGTVEGMLYDLGDYPALLLSDGEGTVHGEIWRCPADLLPRLDAYEGVDEGLFRRVGVAVGGIGCWTYVAGPRLGERLSPEQRIESGTWTDPRS